MQRRDKQGVTNTLTRPVCGLRLRGTQFGSLGGLLMTQEWVECKRAVVVGVTLGVLLLMGAVSAHAQAVGSAAIRGRVADETGAGVPGATVTVSSPSLQLRERTAVSEQDGEYQFRSLPLGTYTVTLRAARIPDDCPRGHPAQRRIRGACRCRAEAVHGAGNRHRERPEPGHRRRPRRRSART